MISAVRRVSFCAGHRIAGHESKCRNLHGHQYEIEIFATAKDLDSLGRVIDFAVLKRIGNWIDQAWDHGFILWHEDSEAWKAMAEIKEQKTFVFPSNPTAENIAKYILEEIAPSVLSGFPVEVWKVVCYETPNCRAEVSIAELSDK